MKILIVDHNEADVIVGSSPSDLIAVVSIYSPPNSRMSAWVNKNGLIRTKPALGFDAFEGHKIALSFDDAESNEAAHDLFPPERHDIKRFLVWADQVPYPASGTMLVHCYAGIARSTACALAFLALKRGPGHEAEYVEYIATIRPETWFNDLIVELADDILGRKGALINAVKKWKNHKCADTLVGTR